MLSTDGSAPSQRTLPGLQLFKRLVCAFVVASDVLSFVADAARLVERAASPARCRARQSVL